ncbi:carbohydrate porin [Phytohalomonas tamaricis]|uniref:carbohydrate porin n=1 Tax=Phytohalomonas tamaricis TaxID=2081032 RepID=UPI0021D47634|nr:carbohydrate porin [Phytohalomonas tamaricis]
MNKRFHYATFMLGLWCACGQAQAYSAFGQDSPWMFGDWNGKRSELSNKGIDFDLRYISESAWNAHGGYDHDRTVRYSDQWTAGINFDLDKLLGISNAEFQFTLTDRNGDDLTADRLVNPAAGNVSSVQEVHGRGNITRITQLWYRQRFYDDALAIKVGRIPVGDDFAVIDSNFQNLFLGSGEPGNQAGGIWYNWPVSQWATTARWNFSPAYYAQIGFFNINPSNLDTDHGLDLKHSGTTGTLIPVEFGWTPKLGAEGLAGKYKLGGYYSTADATDYDADDEGTKDYRVGAYYVIQQQVTTHNGDASRGMSLFSMGTWNDKDTAYIDKYISIGMSYTGPFDARPKDDFGIGLAWANVNDNYDRYTRRSNEDLAGPASPGYLVAQGEEYDAEIYYGFHMANWLTLRPNVQYVIHPGGNSDTDNAIVGGFMAKVDF